MYDIRFTLGDFSQDGHGYSNTYLISSTKCVEEVREAHFKAEEIFGFDPGKMCREYGENHLNQTYAESLLEHGVLSRRI